MRTRNPETVAALKAEMKAATPGETAYTNAWFALVRTIGFYPAYRWFIMESGMVHASDLSPCGHWASLHKQAQTAHANSPCPASLAGAAYIIYSQGYHTQAEAHLKYSAYTCCERAFDALKVTVHAYKYSAPRFYRAAHAVLENI